MEQCKHFNATLVNMLGMLPEKPKSTWREQVPTRVHAYNCTRNNANGFRPILSHVWLKNHIYQLLYSLEQTLLI